LALTVVVASCMALPTIIPAGTTVAALLTTGWIASV